jgi:hypothetical protein
MFRAWYLFENPTLTTSHIIQIGLIKTKLAVMRTHTALITVFPEETTTFILRQ